MSGDSELVKHPDFVSGYEKREGRRDRFKFSFYQRKDLSRAR